MQIIQPLQREEISECLYLPGRRKRFASFLAAGVSGAELSRLLAEGWRKFGVYFFRPECPQCRACIPLRVPTATFVPSRSQRRVLRRGSGLQSSFGGLRSAEQIYDLYRRHSLERFGQESDWDEFLLTFYLPSCPVLQSELWLQGELVGAGFLDVGVDCLSSVYFSFDPRFAHLRPGTFSILQEIEEARRLRLPYYYLGYYVAGSPRLAYKDHFRPRQHYDWQTGCWREAGLPTDYPSGPTS
ncbi:MAG: arginyltransferase [Desulfuromonadales bacterium]|nr:arginyltransferase [Desulfuromonadales bacterium]